MSNQTAHLEPGQDFNDEMQVEQICLARFESAPVTGDQRKSYRYPAQPGREAATVQQGKRKWNAVLCEESAGGMALEIAPPCPLKVDDEVEVGIYTGWYRARVIHVQTCEAGQRVGLQRISVISSADDEQGRPRRRKDAAAPSQWRTLVAVALIAMALGITLTNFFADSDDGQANASPLSGFSYLADKSNHHIRGVLDGVSMLLDKEVSTALSLSPGQRQTIEKVMSRASNSLREAHQQSGDRPEVWEQESNAVIGEALESILCSLTDEQIMQWREVMIRKRAMEQQR